VAERVLGYSPSRWGREYKLIFGVRNDVLHASVKLAYLTRPDAGVAPVLRILNRSPGIGTFSDDPLQAAIGPIDAWVTSERISVDCQRQLFVQGFIVVAGHNGILKPLSRLLFEISHDSRGLAGASIPMYIEAAIGAA